MLNNVNFQKTFGESDNFWIVEHLIQATTAWRKLFSFPDSKTEFATRV